MKILYLLLLRRALKLVSYIYEREKLPHCGFKHCKNHVCLQTREASWVG